MLVRTGLAVALVVPSLAMVLLEGNEAAAVPGTTVRVSVDSAGNQANAATASDASPVATSADGQVVAFVSTATNLVPNDTNGFADVFVRDRNFGTTTRVSINTSGAQANGDSEDVAISGNGRYVVFSSAATNLTNAGIPDNNVSNDIFVHDRNTGVTRRMSVTTEGAESPGSSQRPFISPDGRYVGFDSNAQLVTKTNAGKRDMYVRDRDKDGNGVFDETGVGKVETARVSTGTNGEEGNEHSKRGAMSANARFVVFHSEATNLVAGDTNGFDDVFIRDRDTDADGIYDELGAVSLTRVSTSTGGTQGNNHSWDADVSADGRYTVWYSSATNLVAGDTNGTADVFLYDRTSGIRFLISRDMSVEPAGGWQPKISGSGRYVAFTSSSSNLVAGDTNGLDDVFVRDIDAGTTERASIGTGGAEANGASGNVDIGEDGNDVAFRSVATNLVVGDTNGVYDGFVIDLDAPAPTTTSSPPTSGPPTSTTTTTAPPPTTTTTTTTTVPSTTTTAPPPSTTTTTKPTPTSTTTTTKPTPTSTTTTVPSTTTTTPPPSSTTTTTTLVALPAVPPVPVPAAPTERSRDDGSLIQIEIADALPYYPDSSASSLVKQAVKPAQAVKRFVRATPAGIVILGGLGVTGIVGGLAILGLLGAGPGLFLFPFRRRRKKEEDEDEAGEGSGGS